MTCIFMVQDKAMAPGGYCCVGCCQFVFDSLREKRCVSLTKWAGICVLKILAAHQLNPNWS